MGKAWGCIDIPTYKWIARTAFAFTLEAFVFISGFLFAFQKIILGKSEGIIINKLQRLILPSIIFSIPYFFIFYEYKGIGNFLYSVVNGCGHMWHLHMSFVYISDTSVFVNSIIYNTDFASIVGSYWLPWLGFAYLIFTISILT